VRENAIRLLQHFTQRRRQNRRSRQHAVARTYTLRLASDGSLLTFGNRYYTDALTQNPETVLCGGVHAVQYLGGLALGPPLEVKQLFVLIFNVKKINANI